MRAAKRLLKCYFVRFHLMGIRTYVAEHFSVVSKHKIYKRDLFQKGLNWLEIIAEGAVKVFFWTHFEKEKY